MQLTALADGGCPFQHFEISKMTSTLSLQVQNNKEIVNEIIELKQSGKIFDACYLHFMAQKNIATHNKINCHFTSPLQYYLSLMKMKSANQTCDQENQKC